MVAIPYLSGVNARPTAKVVEPPLNLILMANRISATLEGSKIEEIQSKINDIKTALPFLVEIDKSERRKGQKMGQAATGYVQACMNAASNNTNILARNFDVEEFQKDLNLLNALLPLDDQLETLFQKIRDTVLLVGKDLMEQSNEVYDSVKKEARKNNSLKPLSESLGQFYRKTRAKKGSPDNPA